MLIALPGGPAALGSGASPRRRPCGPVRRAGLFATPIRRVSGLGRGAIDVFFPELLAVRAYIHPWMRPPLAGLGLFGSTLRVVPDNFGVVGAFFIAAGIERDLAWVGQLHRSVVDQGTRPTRTPGRWLSSRRGRLWKRALGQHKNAVPAGRAAQGLVTFGSFTADSVARFTRHIEVLDPPFGLGSKLLKEPSGAPEKLQGSPHPDHLTSCSTRRPPRGWEGGRARGIGNDLR